MLPLLDDPFDVEPGRSDVYPVQHTAVAVTHRMQEQKQRVEEVVPAL